MAYTTDLITVLKSLFDVVKPRFSEETMWSELNRVFESYERLDPRQQIHRRICANFRLDRQISDAESFRHELRELLEGEPLLSSSGRNETGGRNDPRLRPQERLHLPYYAYALAGPATPRGSPMTSRGGPASSREPATAPRPPPEGQKKKEGPMTSPEAEAAYGFWWRRLLCCCLA
jgi:hypothetical protein